MTGSPSAGRPRSGWVRSPTSGCALSPHCSASFSKRDRDSRRTRTATSAAGWVSRIRVTIRRPIKPVPPVTMYFTRYP
ncbi:Uncharacterised protein [Mycobacteroides abscessus subsp. abscessus]|nr:Uncharacterised protein [Mycobacteroides abscessus subsp. abscessus]